MPMLDSSNIIFITESEGETELDKKQNFRSRSMKEPQNDLFTLLKSFEVIEQGHFELTSGLHSDTYLFKDSIWFLPYIRASILNELSSIIKYELGLMNMKGYSIKQPIITGPAQAGAFFACTIASNTMYPFVYCEKDSEGNMVFKRGFSEVIKDSDVVVVEDVATTGGSIKKTVDAVHRNGGNVLFASCMWIRSKNLIPEVNDLIKKDCTLINDPKFFANDYKPSECPLCEQGIPLTDPKTGERFDPKTKEKID